MKPAFIKQTHRFVCLTKKFPPTFPYFRYQMVMKQLLSASVLVFLASKAASAACWPLDTPEETRMGTVPTGVSTRYSHYVTWGCAAPTKLYSQVYFSTPSEITTTLIKAVRTQAGADKYLSQHPPVPLETKEQDFIKQVAVQFGPKVVTASEQPTYQILSNGTRMTTATAKRVPANTACSSSVRILYSSYYSVEGKLATDGTRLGKVAALCKVSSLSGLNTAIN